MSTPQPGAPRRRRIAGERRGRTLPVGPSPDEAAPAPPADTAEPVQSRLEPPVVPPPPAPVAPVRLDKDEPEHAVPDDDELPAADEPETDEQEPARRTGWWGSRASLLALTALLVVLLALAGLAALGLLGTDGVKDIDEADATDRTTRTAPAAAEAAAAAILAYDFKTLDADEDGAKRFMTDDFASEYSDTFEKVVKPAAEQNHARVTASVLGSSAITAGPDTARVLLFVDQTTVSKANRRPQVALNRVEMSMVKSGDTWLVADIASY